MILQKLPPGAPRLLLPRDSFRDSNIRCLCPVFSSTAEGTLPCPFPICTCKVTSTGGVPWQPGKPGTGCPPEAAVLAKGHCACSFLSP